MSFGGTSYQQADPQELAQANQALSDFNDYKKNILPTEQKYLDRAVGRQGRDNLRLGITGASLAQKIDPAIKRNNQEMIVSGVNPNSGKFMAANSGVKRLSIGSGIAGATVMNKSNYLQGLYRAVKGGQSLINGGTGGMNSLAGLNASQNNSDAQYNNAITGAYGDALGNAAGSLWSTTGSSVKGIKNWYNGIGKTPSGTSPIGGTP